MMDISAVTYIGRECKARERTCRHWHRG